MTTKTKTKEPSPLVTRARKLAGDLASMTQAQREAIAARIPSVVNPEGHMLSMRNALLLHMQSGRLDLTMVAGFRQWLKANRCVRKGEHSIGVILVPLSGKLSDRASAAAESSEEAAPVFFRCVPVFDVSQTDPLRDEVSKDGGGDR